MTDNYAAVLSFKCLNCMSTSTVALKLSNMRANGSVCRTSMNTICTIAFARTRKSIRRHMLSTPSACVVPGNRLAINPANHNGANHHRQKQPNQQQQYRYMGRYGGGSRAEEHFISEAFKKLDTKQPKIIIHCERVQLVGCNLLPRPAQNIIERAKIRFRVITHADTVSLDVLKHQIAFTEEQDRRCYPNSKYPTAVFAMNLSAAGTVKLKQMKSFADAIFGAASLVEGKAPVLVCGIPNSGKSSLVLALTRQRTLRVRNKKEYHLPKVSVQAGRTLSTKAHILEFDNKSQITFLDSPGLRPRLEGLNPDTIRLLLASKSVEPFKGYAEHTSNQILMQLLLRATNNYNYMNYSVGKILHERKNSSSTVLQDYAPPTLPDYATAFGLNERTDDPNTFTDAYYRTSKEAISKDPLYLVRKFQSGDFGSWLFTPYRQDVLTDNNISTMRNFNPSHVPIMYMNQAAEEFMSRAADFGANKKEAKKVRDIEKQIRAKERHNSKTDTGPKRSLTDEEVAHLKDIWT